MTRVACIGEAMIELSMAGDTARVNVAGDTLNTAIYLKRSAPAIDVDYISQVGEDEFSARIRGFIESEGIGTGGLRTLAGGSPGLYAISIGDDGERSFTYWRSASAARKLFSDGDFSGLERYDLIYLSGISLAILPQNVRLGLLDYLERSTVRVAYDSNYRPGLWESVECARDITQKYWDRADIALPSIDDEMALFGETSDLAARRCTNIAGLGALKRGEEGPLSVGDPVSQHYAAASEVVDTTAAGDSFNGGYLAAILNGAAQPDALRAGHDLAAQVIRYKGAIIPKSATIL